jgi:hypothetical protein
MKRLFASIILASIFSCGESFDETNLKPPVILIAKELPSAQTYGSVTLKDGTGQYHSFACSNSHFAAAISSTYQVGDTLK